MPAPHITAIIIFLASYSLFIFWANQRTTIALIASAAIVLTGILSWNQALLAINWNVLGIFVGTLVVADVFMQSRVPAYLATKIINKSKNTCWALLSLCFMVSFISIFVENVAAVLIVAPIALSLTKKLNFNPTDLIIALAVCSNLQGAATLIGDPPSMLLGGFAKMNFLDFFFYKGKPSIFFAIETGAVVSFIILYWIFRKHTDKPETIPIDQVKSWAPTWILVGLVVALILSSFFDTEFSYAAGIISMIAGIAAVLWNKIAFQASLRKAFLGIDWKTTFFLVGIFIIVGSLTSTGWIERISDSIAGVVDTNILLGFIILVSLSVIISAFVDNVPFLAAMLPVGLSVSQKMGIEPSLFLFGLLIGASVGGNITPIGASANIVACGILKKEGHTVSFKTFGRIGLPFTIASVVAAAAFLWYVWS